MIVVASRGRQFGAIFALACAFVFALGASALAAPCFANNLIFTTSSANTNIYTVDPQNAFATKNVGTSSFVSAAAARDPLDGKVYYISEDAAPRLGAWDPATATNGVPVALTGLPAHGTFVRAGFDAAGVLYIGDNTNANVYTVNLATGAVTAVTIVGMVAGPGDLAFDPTTPGQYFTLVGAAGSYDLYRVTILTATTATAVRVGPTGVASTVSLFGIAFAANGVLYAGDQASSNVYALNTTTGGAAIAGTSTIAGGINDYASLPTIQTTNLRIVKTHATNPVFPSKPITYSLVVSNVAPAASCTLDSVTVSDALPATLSGAAYAPSTGSYNAATGVWTGLSLGPGSSVTLTIVATVANSATGSISNTATVAPPAGPPGIPDTDNTNNSSTDVAPIAPLANLTIAKSGPATVGANGLIAYSIVVTNPGPSAANGATFSDPVPTGLTIKGAPSCAVTSGAATCGSVTLSGQNVTSTITTFPAGSSVTFTIDATSSTLGSYTNSATTAPPSGTTDQSPSNASSVTTTVSANGGFAKTVRNLTAADATGTSDLGKPGDVLEYGLAYTNTSGAAISNFRITDVVPNATTFVSATCGALPAGVTACAVAGPAVGSVGPVVYTYTGTLAAGATATFLLQVKIV